jgi:hypothetical protein
MIANTPGDTRVEILERATRHLETAAEEFLLGLKWLDILEAGTLDRGRQALRVVEDFLGHADELLGISSSPVGPQPSGPQWSPRDQ